MTSICPSVLVLAQCPAVSVPQGSFWQALQLELFNRLNPSPSSSLLQLQHHLCLPSHMTKSRSQKNKTLFGGLNISKQRMARTEGGFNFSPAFSMCCQAVDRGQSAASSQSLPTGDGQGSHCLRGEFSAPWNLLWSLWTHRETTAGSMGNHLWPKSTWKQTCQGFLPDPPAELPVTHRVAGRQTWVYRKNSSRKRNPREKSLSGSYGGGTESGSHKEQRLDTGAAESGPQTLDSYSAVTLYARPMISLSDMVRIIAPIPLLRVS